MAPSRIPKPSGRQIKNDRRDALMLARLHRAGELTAVYVPRAEDEAIRDLTRAREDAKSDEKRSKQRLLSFLLRSAIRYTGGSPWSKAHMRWRSDIKMPHRSQQVVLQEYIGTVNQCKERVPRLTKQIQQRLAEWRLLPVVQALQSMRGVSTIVAATTVAEIGDLQRFQTPSELMSDLGLVPSEHSSGQKTKRGCITKAGNGHVRRVLTEAAWAYAPLRNLVGPYVLRRLKTDKRIIADLPEKTEMKAFCGLSKKQAVMYARSVEELAMALESLDGIKRRGLVLAYLMRFKQICNDR